MAFKFAILPILTQFIIMGSIWFGIFTPTEAAAVAALYACLLGLLIYRAFGLSDFIREIRGTMIDIAVVVLIIVFTSAFGVVMIRAQLPLALADVLASLTSNGTILMNLSWLVVGCFMAQIPAILILKPILLPIAEQFNLDLIHLGTVMTLTLTLGLLTPPVGMVLYALTRVTGLRFEQLARTVLPCLALILLLVLFPVLITALPNWLL